MNSSLLAGSLLALATLTGLPLPAAAQAGGGPVLIEVRTTRLAGDTLHVQGTGVLRAAQDPRAWLGFSFTLDRDERHERREGSTETRSVTTVTVAQVHPGSPAARAGVRPGDTLVAVDGRTDLPAALSERRLAPGDQVRLRIRRDGRERDVMLRAVERPADVAGAEIHPLRVERRRVVGRDGDPTGHRIIILNNDTIRIPLDSIAARADSVHRRLEVILRDSLAPRLRELERVHGPEIRSRAMAVDSALGRLGRDLVIAVGPRGLAGAEVADLNPELADYFGTASGALVLSVAPETPAARAGLRAGDVVVRAGGVGVASPRDLRRAIVEADRTKQLPLDVIRKGKREALTLRWDG
jgi:S1-C subfamily serine protease